MVFAMGSPVSGRDCVLPESVIVTKTFPPFGGFGSWPSCGVPYLRLALCSSTCVSPGGCPSFYQVWPSAFALDSSSQGLVCGGAPNVGFSSIFLRDVVTLWVKSVFLSLLIANKGYIGGCSFQMLPTLLGSSRRLHLSSFGFLDLLVAGGHTIAWLVTDL